MARVERIRMAPTAVVSHLTLNIIQLKIVDRGMA